MFAGQRFEIDLGDDGDQAGSAGAPPVQGAFVGDILERKATSATPPAPPTLKSVGGFPEHRKRDVQSRFKQKTAGLTAHAAFSDLNRDGPSQTKQQPTVVGAAGKAKSWEEEEKQRIDLENQQKLADMSPEEIEEERRELMTSLGPALLQRLLQRSNIDSGSAEQDLSGKPQPEFDVPEKPREPGRKTVTFAETTAEDDDATTTDTKPVTDNDDLEATTANPLPADSVHFPRPSQPPDLDPSSSTFLEDLHDKYFPSLPSDPDKLEWMQSSTSQTSPYTPTASALRPKDLRFSFAGTLIPPRSASEIPVTAGLHHHGDAPDAAGYTIAELAHLAQSTYAAQRCIAFQTLGRILYRLGRGEFGDSGEPGADVVGAQDTFGELARGLWREVEREKVIEILVRESEGKGADRGRHVSAKAYAMEAVWLWRKGGGRRWKAE